MLRLCLFSVLLFISSSVFSYTLEITEKEIQEKVSAMMPLEKKQFFVTVKLSDPKVELIKDSDRMGIFLNVGAVIPGVMKGAGRGRMTGSISYDPIKGAFYFKEVNIETLEIDNLAPEYAEKIKLLAQTVVSKSMSQYPVYQFKDTDIKQKLAKSTLESVEVKNERLLVTLSIF